MLLVARCGMTGEFTLPDGQVVGSLAPGDVFEADAANARKLLARRQAEKHQPPKKKASKKKG